MRERTGFRRATGLNAFTGLLLLGAALAAHEAPTRRPAARPHRDSEDRAVPPYALGKYVWPELNPGAVEIPFGGDFGHPGQGVFFLRSQPFKVTVKLEVLDLGNMPRMIPNQPRP